jgi:thiamine transporter
MMKRNETVKTMAEIAIFAALGYVLDALAGAYSAPIFVNGGSIGIAMAIVFMISFRRGPIAGVMTGLIIGLLDLADGFYVIPGNEWYRVFSQVLLDYVIAYPLAGLAGLLRPLYLKAKSKKMGILILALGCLMGGILKFFSHYLSGIIFWNDPSGFIWGFTNGYFYSFVYNIAYMGPCIVLCTTLLILIEAKWPFILKPNQNKEVTADVNEGKASK